MAKKTVQLQIHLGGVRVVTISEGETKHFRRFYYTEEGYNCEEVTLEYSGHRIYIGEYYHGRDCDGAHSTNTERFCYEDELTARLSPNKKYQWPAWKKVNSRQYDQYAEMMGY